MVNIIFVIVGGVIGTLSRFTLFNVINNIHKSNFPYATIFVNLLGCFIIGFLWELFEFGTISNSHKLLFFVGILGSFTTFSTFTIEIIHLFRDGQVILGMSYLILSNIFGLVLVFVGMFTSKEIINLVN